MSANTISAFGEADEFLAALKEVGYRQIVVTQAGAYLARMTRITLDHVRLSFVEEQLSRIASVVLAPGMTRILLPPVRGRILCGGVGTDGRYIVTQGVGQRVIERLEGPCWWRDIVISSGYISKFGHALTGTPITVPSTVHVWHPTARALKALSALHAAATWVTETHPGAQHSQQASHGLEQELIDRVANCLSGGPIGVHETQGERCPGIIAKFAESIDTFRDELPPIAHICQELNIDERLLRRCCHAHLGLRPVRYLRVLRMQRVRRALQNGTCRTTTVTEVVQRYGCGQVGRFATEYRALYGELPSQTLRRSKDGSVFERQAQELHKHA